jgi:uncharacterized protein YjbI with pentapeptide repeats
MVMGPEPAAASEPQTADSAPPAIPALAAKADDLEALRTAVIDAAGVSFGLWVSYLFVLFYLLVAAGGVTHRDLFFESPVKLPFLNVDLPLKGFFWLGPALFLVIHAYVLLHFVMLAGKVGVFDVQLRAQIDDREVRTRLRRQLPSNIFVQFLAGPREVRDGIMGFLLWLIALISLVIGPVALLVFFQLQFLPYHEPWITWWQRTAVVVDLVLLWTLWPRVGLRKEASTEKGEARRRGFVEVTQRIFTIVGMLLISVMSVPLVFAIATFPGEWLEERLKPLQSIPLRQALVAGSVDTDSRKPTSLWSNRLVLPGLDVIDHTKLDTEAKIAALPETASLRARHLEGAVLIGAWLYKVDFTAAHLENARLDSANLGAANFKSAQLQGASLDQAYLRGTVLIDAQLQGANLDHAQLQGARLEGAQLRGASLDQADLRGVRLDHAQLQGAVLVYARLQGAVLDEAQLQGAVLIVPQLQGASLNQAQFQGASLYGAQLQGAVLGGAQFQGALLHEAQLQGAVLDEAQLQGASLDLAQLQVASLTRAFVWRADARTANAKDARINGPEIGPKQISGLGINSKVLDWSAESFNSLKQSIGQVVPEGLALRDYPRWILSQEWGGAPRELRAEALARVEPRLDPETPLHEEEQMAERWKKLQRSPAPDTYEAKLAKQWRQIGCSPDGAPYVIAGLIRTMAFGFSPFSPDSVHVPQLAADFLKDGCAGARGLSDRDKGILKALRDRGRAGQPANPVLQRRGGNMK